ncbi:MAG: polysaccharide deacetylase family protein [Acidobacteriia bacterium]|nr:polysaccharide deacetylase family protein [Terriglobia bacterium]
MLDLKLAELLVRYGLPGTFYIPRTAERPVMPASAVRELASRFEIGGHTLRHVNLSTARPEVVQAEVTGCRKWLEDITGTSPAAFCPPGGRYNAATVGVVAGAGYTCMRTVELLSCAPPTRSAGVAIMGTTVQAYPHSASEYLRNIAKRRTWSNLGAYLSVRPDQRDLTGTVKRLLAAAAHRGGYFHLWGHSWEIEECGMWRQLESVFELLASLSPEARFLDNSGICGEHHEN